MPVGSLMTHHVMMGARLFSLLFLLAGCSGYGTLGLQTGYKGQVGLEELKENWNDYALYYSETRERNPSAILFDPKQDDRTVGEKGWYKIDDPALLSQVIGWIKDTKFMPRLHRILGPGGQFYGYLFSAWDNEVVIRAAGEKTVNVKIREVPALFYGGP